MTDKLKAKLWVQACVRLCDSRNIPAFVIGRGDPDAGAILLKINCGPATGCKVLSQVRDGNGDLAWMAATGPDPVPEAKADAYVARQRDIDRDLWVIEIEDAQGRIPFDGPLIA